MLKVNLEAVSNRARWTEQVQVTDENGGLVNLTGATIIFQVRDQSSQRLVLEASTANGTITIDSTGVYSWTFTAAQMDDVDPGTYDVGCLITLSGASGPDQHFVGTVIVIEGVVA